MVYLLILVLALIISAKLRSSFTKAIIFILPLCAAFLGSFFPSQSFQPIDFIQEAPTPISNFFVEVEFYMLVGFVLSQLLIQPISTWITYLRRISQSQNPDNLLLKTSVDFSEPVLSFSLNKKTFILVNRKLLPFYTFVIMRTIKSWAIVLSLSALVCGFILSGIQSTYSLLVIIGLFIALVCYIFEEIASGNSIVKMVLREQLTEKQLSE